MRAIRWPTLTVLVAGVAGVALAAAACAQGDASGDAERAWPLACGTTAPTGVPMATEADTAAAPTGVPTATEADTAACSLDDHIDRAKAATFQAQTVSGSGSAFYIGNGEWLTNHHVVERATRVDLVHGSVSLSAAVEGSLPGYDLALLRAQPPASVRPLRLAAARSAGGARLAVVGFPEGVSGTPSVTRGVASEHASFSQFPSKFDGDGVVLQTNAALSSGNSGGPIVDSYGAVVGVATFNRFLTQGGFGVAAETVAALLAQLRSTPHVARLTDSVARNPSGNPAWSPDGRKMAFVSERDGGPEIYVMNADGSGIARLTDNNVGDWGPTWSPDGQKIAFSSERYGGGIYVMNADGSGVARLTNGFGPAWSPDGRRIAFSSERDGNPNIYVMNADGSGVARLTDSQTGGAGQPAWSPDGRKIAFSEGFAGAGDINIYVMNADGSGVVRLTDSGAHATRPAWSPGGGKIAFALEAREGESGIHVMNADGSRIARLTHNSAGDHSPAWSPDGRQIAFSSFRDDGVSVFYNSVIYVMNADGSGVARLTGNSAGDYEPEWSPDGQQVAFTSERDGDSNIYMMNADGSDIARLTDNSGEDCDPAWSPDGLCGLRSHLIATAARTSTR